MNKIVRKFHGLEEYREFVKKSGGASNVVLTFQSPGDAGDAHRFFSQRRPHSVSGLTGGLRS